MLFPKGICISLIIGVALSLGVFSVSPALETLRKIDGEEISSSRSAHALHGLIGDTAKKLLRQALPMIGYMKVIHGDDPKTGFLAKAIGALVGFTVHQMSDVAFGNLPGFLVDIRTPYPEMAAGLDEDWDSTPVLYSIPIGSGDTSAATIPLDSSPTVLIYHTHTSESFLREIGETDEEKSFSNDLSKTVAYVGEILYVNLRQNYRIPCLHCTTVHDFPSRVGAYYRSAVTLNKILAEYPSLEALVDVHRDSAPRSVSTITIRGKSYARIMFVIGTDNPAWKTNYDFVKKIVDMLEEGYTGVTRNTYYQPAAVYNQHLSPKAVLVEIGGVDNTLEECKNSAEILAWAIASIMTSSTQRQP